MTGAGFTDGAILTRTEEVFDPRDGFVIQQTYKGSLSALQTLQGTFSAGGARVTLNNDAGNRSLLVTFANAAGPPGGGAEVPTDSWTIDTDYVQESLWSNPKIIQLLTQDVTVGDPPAYAAGFASYLADIRALCENALKGFFAAAIPITAGDSISFVQSDGGRGPLSAEQAGLVDNPMWPAAERIYNLMLLGAEAHEVERIVVTRTRTFTGSFSPRKPLATIGTVYSPSSFISSFAVPALVVAQLPIPPTQKPPDTQWGYKQRGNSSTIMWSGKVEEKADWVLAPWSTLLYSYVA